MEFRDRIKELRRVRASELRANPKNWRVHPKAQHDAVRGVLVEIGYADALLARVDKDGSLVLIDGHLTVLDLFGGSGSTLIAAEQTGRRAYLMELDPLYCDVIVRRWEDLTKGKAALATDERERERVCVCERQCADERRPCGPPAASCEAGPAIAGPVTHVAPQPPAPRRGVAEQLA